MNCSFRTIELVNLCRVGLFRMMMEPPWRLTAGGSSRGSHSDFLCKDVVFVGHFVDLAQALAA